MNKYAGLVLLITLLYSCNKQPIETTNINIIGKWQLVESYDNYKTPNTFQWNTIPDSLKIITEYDNANNCTIWQNGAVFYTGKYTVDANHILLSSTSGTVDYNFLVLEKTATNIAVSFKSTYGTYQQKLKLL